MRCLNILLQLAYKDSLLKTKKEKKLKKKKTVWLKADRSKVCLARVMRTSCFLLCFESHSVSKGVPPRVF